MAHKIIEDLNWRYTTKGGYDKDKKISKEDMNIIKESIRLTASSINSQPWKFIIIESDEGKQRLEDTYANPNINTPHAKRASHTILFANKTHYDKNDYKKIVKEDIRAGRTPKEKEKSAIAKGDFAVMKADKDGYNGHWTKAQTYIALGNVLHTLARLRIDSTPLEGIDIKGINKEFANEIGKGYECSFALALGYHSDDDFNYDLPKSRLTSEEIFQTI